MLGTSPSTKEHFREPYLVPKRIEKKILIIGNNPREMTTIYNMLASNRKNHYLSDVCFDISDSFDRIGKTKPEIIFLDDNLPAEDINRFMKVLRSSSKTKGIRTILMKSSNWNLHIFDHMDDYILKETTTNDVLERLISRNTRENHYQIA